MTGSRPVVFLHIGAMKTGTTFVQGLMMQNREQLTAAGLLVPGESWVDQLHAVRDVLGGGLGYPEVGPKSRGAWPVLAREMLEAPAASMVSMEFLSLADPRRARRIAASLAPADVHVILTVRDLTATIPALWQTNVRSGNKDTWHAFMKGVRRADGPARKWGRFSPNTPLRTFLRTQDVPYMLRAWSGAVAADRIHVVTVPRAPSSPTVLWDRLAAVVGVPPEVCAEPPTQANESIGYASTELLRRVNLELGRLSARDYNPTLLDFLALRVLAERRETESRARLDRPTCEFGLAWNDRTRRAIDDAGVDVVGDLEDLPTTMTEQHEQLIDDQQPPPGQDELLDAATTAERAMRRLIRRRARRLARRGLDVDLPADLGGPCPPQTWATSPDPLAAAARQVAGLSRTAIDLQRRLRA